MTKYACVLVGLMFVYAASCAGPKGDTGNNGESITGPQGTVGATGAAGTNGADGEDGAQGPAGPTGPTGPTGPQGTQGVPGSNATPITSLSFCPAQGPSVYPSYFGEYGIVINNQVFAVYFGTTQGSPSVASAFLSLIPPGHYKSTGGYACNFTLRDDNTVVQD